ncbi:hypothetical protein [Celeribacter sp.]|uniref:hypothetical protein n=1 Tax=Celeribacter sp. TaxID=1890673 RepID=UPI003A91AD94
MRVILAVCAIGALSACQMQIPHAEDDPSSAVDDTALSAQIEGEEAALAEADTDAEDGPRGLGAFFASLAPQDTAPPEDVTLAVAVESAEEADLAALSQEFEDAATTEEPRKGLFSFLKPKPQPSPLEGTDIAVVTTDATETAAEDKAEVQESESDTSAVTATPARAGLGGIFSFLKPRPAEEKSPDGEIIPAAMSASPDGADPETSEDFEVRPETHGVDPSVEAGDTAPAPRKGLFGGLFAARPNAGGARPHSTASADVTLPFGVVGINCDDTPSRVGKKVDGFPREGRATWALYDTDPSSTAPRTQLITGFADGCARQITASLVMFGAAGLHEVHRYSDAMKDEPWSRADKAYETVKARACGVKKRTPCPADALPALEQRVTFATVYKQFGGTNGVMELLLGDGKVLAEEVR